MTAGTLCAQEMIMPNKPYELLDTKPGYITINELNSGVGLNLTYADYSKSFFGFTTIHGYQINRSFLIAGGTGIYVYDGKTLVPLFMDFRYRFMVGQFTPYLFGDGGFLFDFSDFNSGTRLFINAGPGVRYTISNNMGLNLGTGLMIQIGDLSRDSFINFKIGVTFKPN